MRGIEFRPRGLIQNPEINRLLTRRLDLKGGAQLPTIAPELMGVIVVADLRDDPSQQALQRTHYSVGRKTAATVGQNSFCELVNPGNSGVLVRILRFIATTTAANSDVAINIDFVTSGLAANAFGFAHDLVNHLGTSGHARAATRISTQVSIGGTLGTFYMGSSGREVYFPEGSWVIPPLTTPRGFYAEADVANVPVSWFLEWTEEQLTAGIPASSNAS